MADAGAERSDKIAAVNTFDVLAGEYELIWPDKAKPRGLNDYYRRVQQNRQAALCLSGGGIRSASFALGVLQALSKKRLLTSFHYLSTVSGGGYIGGWLQRWIYDAKGDAASVMDALDASCRDRVDGSAEAGDATDTSGTPYEPVEPRQIKSLRENSNYITPRVGISSNDTWTAISISVRNIAVNWLLFAPLLLLVTMVPNFFNNWVGWVGIGAAQAPELVYIPYGLSLVCAAVAAWHTCRALPSYRAVEFDVAGAGDGWLLKRIVKWLIGWAMFGTMVLWADVQVLAVKQSAGGSGKLRAVTQQVTEAEGLGPLLTSSLGFALVSAVVALLSLAVSGRMLPKDGKDPERDYRGAFGSDFGIWVAAFAAAAVTIPVGCVIFSELSTTLSYEWGLRLFVTLGPLWLMGSQLMIAFVFAAFRRNSGGTVNADADREWLARLSAVKIKQMLLWAVLAFTTLLLFHLLAMRLSAFNLSLTSLVALASGATAVFGGRAENTGGTSGGGAAAASIMRFLPLSAIISLATFVFAIAILTVFGAIEQALATKIGTALEPWIKASGRGVNTQFGWHLAEKWLDPQVLAHVVIVIVLGYLLYRLDKKIPVNRFSLNGLYRNRLSRAFLGGARLKRNPDPFTGFDPDDNINISDLAPSSAGARVLYPVVNVALNVTATKNLAWQERKAGPFILSPLYCGSDILVREGAPAETSETSASGAYVSAAVYAGREPGQQGQGTGISLATSISISGAAASPNMGYHSSAATAFLMTLFNVRLGAWLPNPAKATTLGQDVYLSSPSSSLRALLRELGGSTDDQGKDIYLSDGGHFENLALYEMIRRRCRFIVVSDAGADPNCDFADLGNAVRKVKIDLGADIIFTKMRISSRTKPIDPQFAWALGDICYGDGQTGKILYIKPSFYDHALPVDVVSYAKASETFPHESTGDQFFSESQFESYRKLGFTFADEIGKRADGGVDYDSVEAFFDAIAKLDGDYEGQEETGLKTGLRRWLGL